jgi:hypothetical protein
MAFLKHLLPAWKRGIEDKRKANAAILASLNRELKDSEKAAIEGKVLMSLNTSSGEWLDQYGKIFGVPRKDDEADETYRQRIINYVLLRRGTIPAIKDAIREFLQDFDSHIEIYEPYNNVFVLNQSKLNGPDHFLGKYYTVAVMDIKIARPFPVSIVDVINDFKPAGVTVRLTYRPGAYGANAAIVNTESTVEAATRLSIMNGMNDRIRGHLNLTSRSKSAGDETGLFTLNSSHLNSSDVLVGARSVTNPAFNFASYSTEDEVFTTDTTIPDVQATTTEMSSDFYAKTGRVAEQYAAQVLDGSITNYLHFTLDVSTFFDVNYSNYLREVEPSGIYTKDTYLSLMDNPNVQYRMKAAVPPSSPSPYTVQLFNVVTGVWDDLQNGTMIYQVTGSKVSMESLENYLSDSGLVFARIKVDPNPSSANYELHLHFFELGFSKEIAVRETVDMGPLEVTSSQQFITIT